MSTKLLAEAMELLDVPEHAQDAEWYARRAALHDAVTKTAEVPPLPDEEWIVSEMSRHIPTGGTGDWLADSVRQAAHAIAARFRVREAAVEKLCAVAEGFDAQVASALKHLETRGAGGQQVPFHGDFAGIPPSGMSRLRWWAHEMREAFAAVRVQ